jgi:hypothetical protein
MSTQYQVCGVCLVIGWVELLIEEGIPRMTVHNVMGDAPRWERRPNEADDGTMANAYDMQIYYQDTTDGCMIVRCSTRSIRIDMIQPIGCDGQL